MQEAMVENKIVQASAESPDKAICPACGGEVHKRKRRRMDGSTIYYYRHKRGVGENCPKRYRLG